MRSTASSSPSPRPPGRGAVAAILACRGSPRRRAAGRARLLLRLPGVVHGRARLLRPGRSSGTGPASSTRPGRRSTAAKGTTAPPLDRRYRVTERRLREQGLRCGSTFQVRGPGLGGDGHPARPSPPGRPGSGRPAHLAVRSRGPGPTVAEVYPRMFTGPVVKSRADARAAAWAGAEIAGADRAGRAGRSPSEDAFDAAVTAVVLSRGRPRCSGELPPVAALEGWALGAWAARHAPPVDPELAGPVDDRGRDAAHEVGPVWLRRASSGTSGSRIASTRKLARMRLVNTDCTVLGWSTTSSSPWYQVTRLGSW